MDPINFQCSFLHRTTETNIYHFKKKHCRIGTIQAWCGWMSASWTVKHQTLTLWLRDSVSPPIGVNILLMLGMLGSTSSICPKTTCPKNMLPHLNSCLLTPWSLKTCNHCEGKITTQLVYKANLNENFIVHQKLCWFDSLIIRRDGGELYETREVWSLWNLVGTVTKCSVLVTIQWNCGLRLT